MSLRTFSRCISAVAEFSSSDQIQNPELSSDHNDQLVQSLLDPIQELVAVLRQRINAETTRKINSVFLTHWEDVLATFKYVAFARVSPAVPAPGFEYESRFGPLSKLIFEFLKLIVSRADNAILMDDDLLDFLQDMWLEHEESSVDIPSTIDQCAEWLSRPLDPLIPTLSTIIRYRMRMALMATFSRSSLRLWDYFEIERTVIAVRAHLSTAVRAYSFGLANAYRHAVFYMQVLEGMREYTNFMGDTEYANSSTRRLVPLYTTVLRHHLDIASPRARMTRDESMEQLTNIAKAAAGILKNCFRVSALESDKNFVRRTLNAGLIEMCMSGAELVISLTGKRYRKLSAELEHIIYAAQVWIVDTTRCRKLRTVITDEITQLSRSEVRRMIDNPLTDKIWYAAVESTIKLYLQRFLEMYCDVCGLHIDSEGTAKRFVCSGCRCSFYCSKRCQRKSWRDGGHRSVCKSFGLSAARALHRAHVAAMEIRQSRTLGPILGVPKYVLVVDYTVQGDLDFAGRARLPRCCTNTHQVPDEYGEEVVDLHSQCKARRLQGVVVTTFTQELYDTVESKRSDPISFMIGIRSPFSLCQSYRHGPFATKSTDSGNFGIMSCRDSYGIVRSCKVDVLPNEPTKAVGQLLSEWDDVDEVWARALTSDLPLWKALKFEAKKMVADYMEMEVQSGVSRPRFGVELVGPISYPVSLFP